MIPSDLHSALNYLSISVVTLAAIWAGYQIAFKRRQISYVTPVLTGSFLIAAACQLARPFIH